MAAILGPFELDDDESRVPIHAQQVNATVGLLEVTELLRDHQQIAPEHLDVVPNCPLQVRALKNLFFSERRAGHLGQHAIGQVVQHRHSPSSRPRIDELLCPINLAGSPPEPRRERGREEYAE